METLHIFYVIVKAMLLWNSYFITQLKVASGKIALTVHKKNKYDVEWR